MSICRCGSVFELTSKEAVWQDKIMLLKDNCCITCQNSITIKRRAAQVAQEKRENHVMLMMQQKNESAARKALRIMKHKGNKVY